MGKCEQRREVEADGRRALNHTKQTARHTERRRNKEEWKDYMNIRGRENDHD